MSLDNAMERLDLYDVLAEVAEHPSHFGVSTIHELYAFVMGYVYAISDQGWRIGNPPLTQFTEWLVRRYGVGNTSMAWSQILCEASIEAQSPMQLFKESIHAYRQRKRSCLARASIQSHHAASGKFQLSYTRSGVYTQIDTPPNHMSIIHYGTDEGVYLEYRFEQHQVDYEVYLPSVDSAKQKAQWDFDVRPDDWIAEAPDPSKLGDERGDFDR